MRETRHQINVIKWSQQPTIRTKWPDLKLLYHIKNETEGGAAQVAIDRVKGTKKGVPDLCLPVPRGNYHALYIELKNETGKPSKAQLWWVEQLNAQGNFCTVCHGWESAVQVISWYLELNA